MPPCCMCRYIR